MAAFKFENILWGVVLFGNWVKICTENIIESIYGIHYLSKYKSVLWIKVILIECIRLNLRYFAILYNENCYLGEAIMALRG